MDEKEFSKLREAYAYNQLVPVIGSGISFTFHLPGWGELIYKIGLNKHFSVDKMDEINRLVDQAQYLDAIDLLLDGKKKEERKIQNNVAEIIKGAKNSINSEKVDNNYIDLSELKKSRFLTTNYDEYLNDFIQGKVVYLSEFEGMDVNLFNRNSYNGSIIPLHGTISRPETIVFSRKSYDNLYDTDEFEAEFQFLRQSYTFLFMGFSFDDEKFRQMFEKLSTRLNARHYILFDENEKKNVKKIDELENRYHVHPIFYNAARQGHINAIREIIEKIIYFEDVDIDLSYLKKLPVKEKKIKKTKTSNSRIVNLLKKCKLALAEQKPGQAIKCARKILSSEAFRKISQEEKNETYHICMSSYGMMKKIRQAAKYGDIIYESEKNSKVFIIEYAQILINNGQWEKAANILEENNEVCGKLGSLLKDIAREFSVVLSDKKMINGKYRVYDETPWSIEKMKKRESEYKIFKEKYVSSVTYNLLKVESYETGDNQEIAYYWLSIAAGQLFHQHEDALQFLYRAYEISKKASYYEELGQNYLAIAEEKIRYKKDNWLFQIDKSKLMKAKECFELAFSEEDRMYRNSFYENCGLAYLRVLFLLKLDYKFQKCYSKVSKYYKDEIELYKMKAEVDARYSYKINYSLIQTFPDKDKIYIKALQQYSLAGLYDRKDEPERASIYRLRCIATIKKYKGHSNEKSLILILLDALFFESNREEFLKYKDIYEKNFGKEEIYTAFEYELSDERDNSERILSNAFKKNPCVENFVILRGLYLRYKDWNKVFILYKEVMDRYKEIIYDVSDFYGSYIYFALIAKELRLAINLYVKYWRFLDNVDARIEIEEFLKNQVMDFSNYKERVEEKKKTFPYVPKLVKNQVYQDIIRLYLTNYKLDEAKQSLLIMQKEIGESDSIFNNVCDILQCRQSEEKYAKEYIPQISVKKMQSILKIANRDEQFRRYCLGKKGKRMIMSVEMLALMIEGERIDELEQIEKIYISYAGVMNLQSSLWQMEDRLVRSTNYWIMQADNVELFAPSLIGICTWLDEHPEIDINHIELEAVQCIVFAEERREELE